LKRAILWIMFALLLSPVFGIKIWQKDNKWFDLNFISESEYAHSFIVGNKFSEHFMTDNNLAVDINHLNFKIGICDYRTKHFFEPLSGVDSLDYYQTNEMEAVYTDVAIYMEPRMRVIFSLSASSINQPPPYYDRLSTPVGKITLLRQFPWRYAFISLEGAYSTNLQTNESVHSGKAPGAKYVGAANYVTDNTVFFNTPDLFDVSKHHYKASVTY
jgi:hypothetical protein